MHLAVVVTDLPATDETPVAAAAAPPAMPALEALLRQADRQPLRSGWREFLLRAALPELDAAMASPAAVAAASLDDLRGRGDEVWIAQPVHLLAAGDHLRMHPAGLLRLAPGETTRLATDFARVFGADGLELHPASGGFVLTGLRTSGADPGDPAPHAGSRIDAAQRGGGRELRRLASEIELWLHDHPVNRERARRGELDVTALWLWGGGPCVAPPELPEARLVRFIGDDVFVAGIARVAGADFVSTADPAGAAQVLAAAAGQGGATFLQVSAAAQARAVEPALARLDRELFTPLAALARDGTVRDLQVAIAGLHAHWRPSHRRRFWRRMRPWWEHPRQ